MKKFIAEFIGTFTLVLFGTGVAVITGDPLFTALAFGLSIIASAFVIGNISGCHVNPAVSLAMLIDKRISLKDFCGYVVAQIAGAFAGSGLLYFLLKNTAVKTIQLATNGYGEASVANLTLVGAIVLELVLTFIFVYTVLGVTKDESKSNVAPFAIGLTLALVHLLGFYLTGTSVNPARSLAPAVLMGVNEIAFKQVWVFIVAPLVGGAFAAAVFRLLNTTKVKAAVKEEKVEEKVTVKKATKKKSK